MRYPLALLAVFLVAAGCGGDDLKAEGEECVASSECEDGLTCDFGASPPVCRAMQTPIPDASAVPTDAPGPVIDADPNAPDAPPGTPDATPPPPDAPPPDAAPVDAATIDA